MKLALILVVGVYNMASIQGGRLSVTLFALSLGAESWEVGGLVALYYMLPIFMGLAIGRQIDRAGVGVALAACGIASAASFLLPFALPGLVSLALSACLAGMACVGASVAANVMVSILGGPEDRTRNYSWFALASSAGAAIGPLIAGYGIDHMGHRLNFLLLSGIPLVMLVVLFAGRRLFPRASAIREPSTASLLALVRAPGILLPLFGSALAPVVLDLFFFVVSLYGASIGLSASTIGIILGCCSGASIGLRFVLPLLARYMREWTLVAMAFGLSGLMLMMVPLANGVPMLVVIALIAGMGMGVSAPMVLVVLSKSLPEGRAGELLGVRAVMLSVGQTAAPALVGLLGGIVGLVPVVAALGLGVMAYGWQAQKEGRRRRVQH